MKSILILVAVTAMALLVFVPVALAQSVPPAYEPMPGFNQPDYLNPAFDNPDIPSGGGTAPASPSSATTSPAATASPSATASSSATASPSASASASASTTSSASPNASASTLPDTGGISLHPALSLVAFLVLVGSGALVLKLTRGRDAAP
jgi:hypothetical protein